MRRLHIALLSVVVLALAPAAIAAAPAPAPTIAPGIGAGGVDLSNLTIADATAKLQAALGPALARPVAVHVAGRRFALAAKDAKLAFNADLTARRAFHAGIGRPAGSPPLQVPLAIRHSHIAVTAFAASVARAVARPATDATITITLQRMVPNHSKPGLAVDQKTLAAAVDAALDAPAAPHLVRPALGKTKPKVTVADLPRRYGTVLTVDRNHFKLRLFKRLRLVKTYGIAVGMAGLETPAGVYHITDKQVNPSWHVPNSPWAGSLAGQTIPPGPNDPLKARWLGIANGVGIHGTAEDWSIGSRASHGCIRMHVSDVIALYPRVPMGTPVLIK
ncbi:MAG: L,D-transpeptidase family protein [Solirubrobacterales bacterium]|jgi:lipoprotein-anchoring transpeptidase ErfK/SrfK|nr:L,D-transpeptidase family protein [Solirubrobacterales bacterium]